MPKCPECGHQIKIESKQFRRTGVRSRRLSGNRFEYEITLPEYATADGRTNTVADDLKLTAAFALPVGAAFGFMASLAVPEFTVQIIGLGASAGTALAWGWLCSEHNQRLKRVVPWFVEQSKKWPHAGGIPINDGAVTLTVDHIHRDGSTEAGRTVEYFGPLPVDASRFGQWAAAVLGNETVPGVSLAQREWTPLNKGKLFARTEYEPLLAQMVKGGTVVNLPGKGHILTGGGQRALRQHLKAYPPALLGSVYNG